MKRNQRKRQSFKELEELWYQKLKEEGFEDIEDTSDPNRPLKDWHSRKFRSSYAKARRDSSDEHQKRLSDFLNNDKITEICKSMTEHKNCSLTPKQARKVLELHREGKTQRQIAKKIKCGKMAVHNALTKAREWMKVA